MRCDGDGFFLKMMRRDEMNRESFFLYDSGTTHDLLYGGVFSLEMQEGIGLLGLGRLVCNCTVRNSFFFLLLSVWFIPSNLAVLDLVVSSFHFPLLLLLLLPF